MKTKGKFYVGTSGWVYKSWHKKLYPPEIKKNFLEHYSKHFNTVEINTSFYHLPKLSTFEKWKNETPADFIFSAKLSRYITHIERLKDVKAPLKRFFESARGLGNKLGIVLIQLPPSLKFDDKTFKKFVVDLDMARKLGRRKIRVALEPRHDSWFSDDNIETIRTKFKLRKTALVFAHSSVFPKYQPIDQNVTTNYIYLRFHGPKEFAISEYGSRRLKPWAEIIKKYLRRGMTVFAYFNDDAHGYAVKDARILRDLVTLKA